MRGFELAVALRDLPVALPAVWRVSGSWPVTYVFYRSQILIYLKSWTETSAIVSKS